jgi:hypothetical protein
VGSPLKTPDDSEHTEESSEEEVKQKDEPLTDELPDFDNDDAKPKAKAKSAPVEATAGEKPGNTKPAKPEKPPEDKDKMPAVKTMLKITCPHCGNDSVHDLGPMKEAPVVETALMIYEEIFGVDGEDMGCLAVIDTGASKSFISASTAERVVTGMTEDMFSVSADDRSSFRFANGEGGVTSSTLEIKGNESIPRMVFQVMECSDKSTGLPPLIGADWLHQNQAEISYSSMTMSIFEKGGRRSVPITRAKNGHLLMRIKDLSRKQHESAGSSKS